MNSDWLTKTDSGHDIELLWERIPLSNTNYSMKDIYDDDIKHWTRILNYLEDPPKGHIDKDLLADHCARSFSSLCEAYRGKCSVCGVCNLKDNILAIIHESRAKETKYRHLANMVRSFIERIKERKREVLDGEIKEEEPLIDARKRSVKRRKAQNTRKNISKPKQKVRQKPSKAGKQPAANSRKTEPGKRSTRQSNRRRPTKS